MKTALTFAGLCLLAATTLQASPNRSVAVEERFAGSNDSTYAILRTEIDNLGSYSTSQRKVFLDERSKDGKTTVKSTLLLEEKRSVDEYQKDPKKQPTVSVTLISKDDSVSMASVQEKFPQQSAKTWDAEKLRRLEVIPAVGVVFPRIHLADAGSIVKDTFGGRDPELGWELLEVVEDNNTIYLKLGKGLENEAPETRLVCIGLEKTWQFRAQADRKGLYLLAGIYKGKEEALAQARKWLDEGHSTLQVWEYPSQNDYAIVDAQAEERIKTLGGMKKLAEKLGVEMQPISGDLLGQRIEVP